MVNLGVKWSVRVDDASELKEAIKLLSEYVPNLPNVPTMAFGYELVSPHYPTAHAYTNDGEIVDFDECTNGKQRHTEVINQVCDALRFSALLTKNKRPEVQEEYKRLFQFPVVISIKCYPFKWTSKPSSPQSPQPAAAPQ